MNRVTFAAVLCTLAAPAPALACGGFFCSSAPIDQAGETIVYGLEDDGTLTMSVQLRYEGDDDDFAWILPVVAPPELSLGSEALFDELRAATRLSFAIDNVTEGVCRPAPRCVSGSSCTSVSAGGGCGGGGSGETWTGGFVDAAAEPPRRDPPSQDAGMPTGGVTIYSQDTIGPYDSVVLGAATAQEVVDWLRDNNYDVPPESVPLLETYAEANNVFVALRLSSNARTRVIRPIVLRMPTSEACLPIRLTAIATVPDMPITAFFLGPAQVRPANYNTAMIDTNDIDFWRGTRSWDNAFEEEVTRLGGHAFATIYAGRTPALELELEEIDDLAAETDPASFLRALGERGYQTEPRLRELLEQLMPPPEGRDATRYYNCLFQGTTAACGAPQAFEPAILVDRIDAEITVPRAEAQALVHRHGTLTRLYTTMSAEDMTIDPVFVTDDGLPDQPNVLRAEWVTACSDDYFEGEAPQFWRVGDVTETLFEGLPANDREYCGRLGGVLAEDAMCPESSMSSGGGCLCAVGGTAPIQGGALFALAMVLLGRRIRRRQS